MNAKKVKAIRAFVRNQKRDPREDRYVAVEATRRTKAYGLGSEVRHYQTVSFRLAPGCGRALYQGMKQAAAGAA